MALLQGGRLLEQLDDTGILRSSFHNITTVLLLQLRNPFLEIKIGPWFPGGLTECKHASCHFHSCMIWIVFQNEFVCNEIIIIIDSQRQGMFDLSQNLLVIVTDRSRDYLTTAVATARRVFG